MLETARRTLANKQKIESPAVPKYAAVVESFEQVIILLKDASKAESMEATEREEEDDGGAMQSDASVLPALEEYPAGQAWQVIVAST